MSAELQSLVGQEFGPGDWTAISADETQVYATAIGSSLPRVEPLLLLSRLPSLTQAIPFPVEVRTSINYGLESMKCCRVPAVGERFRARMTLLHVDDIPNGAQLKRLVTIESELGDVLLEAITLTRWLF